MVSSAQCHTQLLPLGQDVFLPEKADVPKQLLALGVVENFMRVLLNSSRYFPLLVCSASMHLKKFSMDGTRSR